MQKSNILKFAAAIVLSLSVLTLQAKSQSLQTNSTLSTPTVPVSLSTLEKAKKAADEVEVSRILISAQEAEIKSLQTNLLLEQNKSALLQSLLTLTEKQSVNKDLIIAAQEKNIIALTSRNAKLEKSNSRLRKIGTILGAATAVLGYIVFH